MPSAGSLAWRRRSVASAGDAGPNPRRARWRGHRSRHRERWRVGAHCSASSASARRRPFSRPYAAGASRRPGQVRTHARSSQASPASAPTPRSAAPGRPARTAGSTGLGTRAARPRRSAPPPARPRYPLGGDELRGHLEGRVVGPEPADLVQARQALVVRRTQVARVRREQALEAGGVAVAPRTLVLGDPRCDIHGPSLPSRPGVGTADNAPARADRPSCLR